MTEREKFEAWLIGHRCMLDGSDQFARYKSDGKYVDGSTALAWTAWQVATRAPTLCPECDREWEQTSINGDTP